MRRPPQPRARTVSHARPHKHSWPCAVDNVKFWLAYVLHAVSTVSSTESICILQHCSMINLQFAGSRQCRRLLFLLAWPNLPCAAGVSMAAATCQSCDMVLPGGLRGCGRFRSFCVAYVLPLQNGKMLSAHVLKTWSGLDVQQQQRVASQSSCAAGGLRRKQQLTCSCRS